MADTQNEEATSGDSLESLHAERLTAAVRAIEADPNLRAFVAEVLAFCNLLPQPSASIFHENPYVHARNQGLVDAGNFIIGLLASAEPLLWPSMLLEYSNAS